MTHESKEIIKDLLDHARANYEIKQLGDLQELYQVLNKPGFIKDKDMALSICNALLHICIEDGGMAKNSIMHLLGLQLMNYIEAGK